MSEHKLPNRFKVVLERFLKLSFYQRLRILFGYNVVAEVSILIDKRDGRVFTEDSPDVHNGIRLSLTPAPDAQALHRDRLQQAVKQATVQV